MSPRRFSFSAMLTLQVPLRRTNARTTFDRERSSRENGPQRSYLESMDFVAKGAIPQIGAFNTHRGKRFGPHDRSISRSGPGAAMSLESILDKLHGVKRNGGGWMALCPAHADKNPSLSIKEDKGKVLLKCFAGCTLEAIRTAAGIEMHELFPDNNPAPHIKATYDYVDEGGNLLYQVVRYQPKS